MKYNLFLIPLVLVLPIEVIAENNKGMTWGFSGWTDIKSGETSIPQTGRAKLGCNSSFTPLIPGGPTKCDAYKGDTACSQKRYILCIAKPNNPYFQHQPPFNNPNTNNPNHPDYNPSNPYFTLSSPPYNRPRYKIHHQAHAMPKEFYAGWVDQPVKLSKTKIEGSELTSPAKADELCGVGWRMAEFHDGKYMPGMDYNVPSTYGNNWNPTKTGGWSFHAPLAADRNMGPDGPNSHPANSGSNARINFKKNRYWVKSNTTPANCWN